ncbi:hypothetical protein LEP1GSC047_1050 [Leptospira inadai serovar Lyme str. 10]|uniref:Uncharacterized protein n=1 Tax=Leptospira inadai serovar Lyme str. 10 TaxID=1049790 RepID=V6H9J1_9LEPT|nr:hypothetical protein LEP1GSC047_1050 [Leptospira inadai serovar Lyme str. 10]
MLKFPGYKPERNLSVSKREKYLPLSKISHRTSHPRQKRFRQRNREKRQTNNP